MPRPSAAPVEPSPCTVRGATRHTGAGVRQRRGKLEGEPLTLPGEANGESRVQTDGGGPAGKNLMEMMGKTFGPWEQHILRPT